MWHLLLFKKKNDGRYCIEEDIVLKDIVLEDIVFFLLSPPV
jgi:hypothetical protein